MAIAPSASWRNDNDAALNTSHTNASTAAQWRIMANNTQQRVMTNRQPMALILRRNAFNGSNGVA